MTISITVNQTGKPAGVAGKAREDLSLGVPVVVSATGGDGTFAWRIGDAPPNDAMTTKSAASLSASTGSSVTLTPDNGGTYRLLATSAGETQAVTFYAGTALSTDPSQLPHREPAFGEQTEHTAPDALDTGGNVNGWERELRRWMKAVKRIAARYLDKNGDTMAGVLDLGNHKITTLADGSDPQDAVNYRQLHGLSIDDLAAAFAIAGFSVTGTNVAAVVQVGTTLSSITAAATYVSGPPSTATISDTAGGTWSISGPYASGSRAGTISSSTNNFSCTFTLTAYGPKGAKTASVTIYWDPKVYHGPATPGTYNASFITALSSNLQPSRACSFTDTMGAGQYDYYAAPSSYGTPTFIYGVLPGGWSLVASGVSVTSNGVTQNYDLWKSNQPNLGATLWTVS